MHTLAVLIKRSDVSLFYFLNRKMRCQFLSIMMKGMTQLGSTVFSILISAIFLVLGKWSRENIGVQLSCTLILSQIFAQFIKRLVNRPRPYVVLEQAIAIKPPACQYSFPSGHTCAAFSMALVLTSNIPALGIVFISLGTLVGLSRIYLGFHYPTDVVIGSLTAMVSFLCVSMFLIPM